jgi:hypothetical protein
MIRIARPCNRTLAQAVFVFSTKALLPVPLLGRGYFKNFPPGLFLGRYLSVPMEQRSAQRDKVDGTN